MDVVRRHAPPHRLRGPSEGVRNRGDRATPVVENIRSEKIRQKGSLNRIPTDLKRDVIAGFAKHGSDGAGKDGVVGFAYYLAAKHPKVAGKILERLLPLTIKGDGLTSSTISTVNIVSVPAGKFLSPEEVAAFSPRSLPQIDQEIVRGWSDEPSQLEHASAPVQSVPERLESREQPDEPALERARSRLQSSDEAQLQDELSNLSREERLRSR